MALEILTLPALNDNYMYVAHDPVSGDTAVVDVPEAAPAIAALTERDWTLTDIFLTHHHWDHVDGLDELLAACPARVHGAAADAHRLRKLDSAFAEGDEIRIGQEKGIVLDVSGHTIGHVALHFPESKAVFTADSLMALGCGRLFEGTPDQMWESLGKLMSLAPDTIVYSGHEYTQSNAKFALTIEPDNSALISRAKEIDVARADGQPTVPSTLSEELATNPFLRAGLPGYGSHVGLPDASPAQVFAEIRRRKDNF